MSAFQTNIFGQCCCASLFPVIQTLHNKIELLEKLRSFESGIAGTIRYSFVNIPYYFNAGEDIPYGPPKRHDVKLKWPAHSDEWAMYISDMLVSDEKINELRLNEGR